MIGHDYEDADLWADEDGQLYKESGEGAAALDATAAVLDRFVAFPEHGLTAVTLWAAHAHAVESFDSTPRLALLSPEPGSGKSRTLEVVELLTPEPMSILNASTAAIFRTLQEKTPTLLMDEVDAIFGKHGKDDSAEDLRGLLNAGHRKGTRIPRCVGPMHTVTLFPVYAPVALAGLGDLPDTLMSRSVVVRMRRRLPHEHVEPFRMRQHEQACTQVGEHLGAWVRSVVDTLAQAWPELPDDVTDRPADVWEPLVAIADAAGGRWPTLARDACSALVKAANTTDSGSLGIRLLADLRDVFGDKPAMSTAAILSMLHEIDEAPWADLRGKALDARGLARRLNPYGITSMKVKIDGQSLQGYRREDLHDAWQRYLPPRKSGTSGTNGTETANTQVTAPQDGSTQGSTDEQGSGTVLASGTADTGSDLQGSGSSTRSGLAGSDGQRRWPLCTRCGRQEVYRSGHTVCGLCQLAEKRAAT